MIIDNQEAINNERNTIHQSFYNYHSEGEHPKTTQRTKLLKQGIANLLIHGHLVLKKLAEKRFFDSLRSKFKNPNSKLLVEANFYQNLNQKQTKQQDQDEYKNINKNWTFSPLSMCYQGKI